MKRVSMLVPITAIIAACILLSAMILFAWNFNQPKTVYRSDSVEVVKKGVITTVYDLSAQKEYSFEAKRIKRSQAKMEPITAIDTETVKITKLPSAGLEIYDKQANRVFTVQRTRFGQ